MQFLQPEVTIAVEASRNFGGLPRNVTGRSWKGESHRELDKVTYSEEMTNALHTILARRHSEAPDMLGSMSKKK